MRIINLGSCTIDHVYTVPHFAAPGETLSCQSYDVYPGGKGLNQSIAIARAGGKVHHGGRIGNDGRFLKDLLDDAGVDTGALVIDDGATGQAVIQVTPDGENSIVIFGGANQRINRQDVERTLSNARAGEYLLLQNEISELPFIMQSAAALDLRIVFNVAPMTDAARRLPLELVELFIVNEMEAESLAGAHSSEAVLTEMTLRYPNATTVMTLGARGAVYGKGDERIEQPGFDVDVVDTTGAGDTFTGYLLAALARGEKIRTSLEEACRAAAFSVTRPGAASSIPRRDELDGLTPARPA